MGTEIAETESVFIEGSKMDLRGHKEVCLIHIPPVSPELLNFSNVSEL